MTARQPLKKNYNKHNIQKIHIHIFQNRLLREVVKVLQLFLVFRNSVRKFIELTLQRVQALHLLKILV